MCQIASYLIEKKEYQKAIDYFAKSVKLSLGLYYFKILIYKLLENEDHEKEGKNTIPEKFTFFFKK